MGNQLKGTSASERFSYVECTRLKINRKREEKPKGDIQKIFGSRFSLVDKESIIKESCVLHKESTVSSSGSIGLRGAKHIVSQMQLLPVIEERVPCAVAIITAKNSPVKHEYGLVNAEKTNINSSLRHRHHYFKLKGCHPDQ